MSDRIIVTTSKIDFEKVFLFVSLGCRIIVKDLFEQPITNNQQLFHSLLKLLLGFIVAAFNACALTIIIAKANEIKPANANAHQGKSIR